MEHICCTSPPEAQGIIVKDGAERVQDLEALGGHKETVSFRHSRAIAFVDSAHSNCDSMPETYAPSRQFKSKHEVGHETPPLSIVLLANCCLLGDRKSVLSKSVALDKLTMFQWEATDRIKFWQLRLGLLGRN